jgi:hypothetical protein
MASACFRPIRDLGKAFCNNVNHARIPPEKITLYSLLNSLDFDSFGAIITLIIITDSTIRLFVPSCTNDTLQWKNVCHCIASRPPAAVVWLTRHPIKHCVEDVKGRLGIASLYQSLPVWLDTQQASKSLEFNVEVFEMSHHVVEVLHTVMNNM